MEAQNTPVKLSAATRCLGSALGLLALDFLMEIELLLKRYIAAATALIKIDFPNQEESTTRSRPPALSVR